MSEYDTQAGASQEPAAGSGSEGVTGPEGGAGADFGSDDALSGGTDDPGAGTDSGAGSSFGCADTETADDDEGVQELGSESRGDGLGGQSDSSYGDEPVSDRPGGSGGEDGFGSDAAAEGSERG